MNLSKREKILLIVFMAVFSLFLYYRYVFQPQDGKIAVLEREYGNLTLTYNQSKTMEAAMESLNKKLSRLEEEISQKDPRLMIPIFIPDIMDELDGAASRYEINIDTLEFGGMSSILKKDENYNEEDIDVQDSVVKLQQKLDEQLKKIIGDDSENSQRTEIVNESLQELYVMLGFTGSFQNCMSFIEYLENDERLYTIVEFDIGRLSETGYTVFLNAGIYSLQPSINEIGNGEGSARTNLFE